MAELTRVRVWAAELISAHLNPDDWTFDFDHAKRRAGQCDFGRRRITVSRHLAARLTDAAVHQVLLHEVAHAIAGPHAGHGPEWRRIARELGYVGGRTHDGEIASDLAPWVGRCPGGHEHVRFRRPNRVASCARCARGFSAQHLITWTSRRDLASRSHVA